MIKGLGYTFSEDLTKRIHLTYFIYGRIAYKLYPEGSFDKSAFKPKELLKHKNGAIIYYKRRRRESKNKTIK